MQRIFAGVILTAAVAVALCPTRADALMIMIPSGPAKISQADVVVTGQVLTLEDRDMEAAPAPGALNKATYRIAVIQITETLKGDSKQKMVRVGFIVPKLVPPGPGPGPKFPPIKTGGGNYNVQLTVGQNGMFFLRKHAAGFYTLPMFGTFVDAQNKENYDNELATTRKTLKVLDNPLASLKAANAEQRLEAAYYLITMYRTAPFGAPAQEMPVNLEEGQLILKTLLEADWDQTKYQGNKYQQHPAQLFSRLNIGPASGFQFPVGKGLFSPEYTNTAKNWLAQNWQTYRIQKFVAAAPKLDSPANPALNDR